MTERRKVRRRRSYLGGRIVFNNGMSTIDCLIRDISPEGARLVVHDAYAIPDRFELLITVRGERFKAMKVWRDPGDAGIRFVHGPAL
jgi:hypothetical protein